jgi:HEAT repeat protein
MQARWRRPSAPSVTLAILVVLGLVVGCGKEDSRSPSTEGPTPIPSVLQRTIDDLVARLEVDPDDADAGAALAALGSVGIPTLRTAMGHPDPDVRIALVNVLEAVATDDAVDPLLRTLDDTDENVRVEAVEALGVVKNRRAVLPMLARYPRENDAQVRYEILTTLGLIGDPAAVALLDTETRSRDPYARMWAMSALCALRERSAARLVIAMIRDPELYVRRHVLSSCGVALDSTEGHAALIETALTAVNFDEAVRARRNLQGYLQRGASVTDLQRRIRAAALAALQGAQQPERAALLLADIGDPAGADALIAALEHLDPFVRHHAAYELGRLGDARAVPGLIKALSDSYELVAATAHDALLVFADGNDERARAAVAGYAGPRLERRLRKN